MGRDAELSSVVDQIIEKLKEYGSLQKFCWERKKKILLYSPIFFFTVGTLGLGTTESDGLFW